MRRCEFLGVAGLSSLVAGRVAGCEQSEFPATAKYALGNKVFGSYKIFCDQLIAWREISAKT